MQWGGSASGGEAAVDSGESAMQDEGGGISSNFLATSDIGFAFLLLSLRRVVGFAWMSLYYDL